ncbi:Leucine-rich repeat-containing protein [Plasmodiophora brassicae]|nr:hypothetical protein PBRA_005249 [Plasmodiophora brassicae]
MEGAIGLARRRLKKRTLLAHLHGTISCVTGLAKHTLVGSKRRLIDRCRHDDPSLTSVKWEDNPGDVQRRAVVATCRACEGFEITMLGSALLPNRHVRLLDISGFRLSPPAIDSIATVLHSNTALVHIVLDQTGLGDDGLAKVAHSLKDNATLLILSMRRVDVTWAGAESLAGALAVNSTLTTLDIRDNYIYHKGVRALTEAVSANRRSRLSRFDVQSTAVNHKGVNALSSLLLLPHFRCQLLHLNLSNNTAGAMGIATLASALRVNRSLVSLDISGNSCGEDGAAQMADAVRCNTSLGHLDLSRNEIGDRGAIAIAMAMQENSSLQHMDVGYNKIGNLGLRALSRALLINGRIVSMDISSNVADRVLQGCYTYEICRRQRRNRSRFALAARLSTMLGVRYKRDGAAGSPPPPPHSCSSCFDRRMGAKTDDDVGDVIERIRTFTFGF